MTLIAANLHVLEHIIKQFIDVMLVHTNVHKKQLIAEKILVVVLNVERDYVLVNEDKYTNTYSNNL